MPLRNYMIAHKEKKYFRPQKDIAHSIKISRGFYNKLYLYKIVFELLSARET